MRNLTGMKQPAIARSGCFWIPSIIVRPSVIAAIVLYQGRSFFLRCDEGRHIWASFIAPGAREAAVMTRQSQSIYQVSHCAWQSYTEPIEGKDVHMTPAAAVVGGTRRSAGQAVRLEEGTVA